MQNIKTLSSIRVQNGQVWFSAEQQNGKYVLDWAQTARAVLSSGGRLLQFKSKPGAGKISLTMVKNMVRAYGNSLRGKESLHATVLTKNGKAIALCGMSGEGKSTLAAYFLMNSKLPNYKLLTDDVAYLSFSSSRVFVKQNQTAYLKLGKSTLDYFKNHSKSKIKNPKLNTVFDPNLEKEIIFFKKSKIKNPKSKIQNPGGVPLVAVYQLWRAKHDTPVCLERIKGAKAALILSGNIYNEILRPEGVLQRQFNLCVKIAHRVPVYRLTYQDGFSRLREVGKMISAMSNVKIQMSNFMNRHEERGAPPSGRASPRRGGRREEKQF